MPLKKLQKKLGIDFKNEDLLQQALVHRSYLNENPRFPLPHNERLEFLGDAVLELAVTEYLYQHLPNPEGELTNLRSALVKGEMLAKIAHNLDIDDHILLSRGEKKDHGKARQMILANALEAVIGAIYLDAGLKKSKEFVEKKVLVHLGEIIKKGEYIDAKSRFQELAQEKVRITPSYKVLKETGPDHAKKFTMGVFLNEKLMAKGEGMSKQEAEQEAAREALKKSKWQEQNLK